LKLVKYNLFKFFLIFILFIIALVTGYLTSGVNCYNLFDLCHTKVYVNELNYFVEKANWNYNKDFQPFLWSKIAFTFIYLAIINLLVYLIFDKKIFGQLTFYSTLLFFSVFSISIIVRLYKLELYENYQFVFFKSYLFGVGVLSPPILELVYITAFAYINQEMKKYNKKNDE